MEYRRDNTGRFNQRPHFSPEYIEQLCEDTILHFAMNSTGNIQYPILSDTLTKLIERDTDELDLFTDMTHHGLDDKVDGFTEYIDNKPSVYINKRLSSLKHLETRLRTTLAHEYGHILLHSPLFREDSECKLIKPFGQWEHTIHDTISQRANSHDWMEWQANYAMGALLMPRSGVLEFVAWYKQRYGFCPPFDVKTGHAQQIVEHARKKFFVSPDAAKFRLKQMFLIN